MKSQKTILILLAVLVVLSVSYLVTKNHHTEKGDSSQTITALENLNPTEFSYQNNQRTYSFVLKNDTWTSTEAISADLKKSTITEFFTELSQLAPERVLKKPDTLKEYGLDSPQYTVKIQQNNRDLTLLFSTLNSVHYLSISGDNSVYVLSDLPSELDYDIIKWMDTPSLPYVNADNITKISAQGYSLVKEQSSSGRSTWKLTTPSGSSKELKKTDQISTLLMSLSNLYLTDCVDYNVTDSSKLASYGLKDPVTSFTLTYQNSKTKKSAFYTLDIGTSSSDGSTYVMLNRSGYISLLSQDETTALKNALQDFYQSIS